MHELPEEIHFQTGGTIEKTQDDDEHAETNRKIFKSSDIKKVAYIEDKIEKEINNVEL